MKNQIKLKNQKGITLVALVVTIIVMLILAGVAINLTIGDNGIFKRAEESTKIYQNAANNEAKELNTAVGEIGKLIMGIDLNIQYTSTKDSITVQVNGVKATGYIFSIKKVDEDNYTAMPEQTESTYTFTGLEMGVTYKIKIEIKTETVTLEEEIEVTTVEIPGAEGIIKFENLVWKDGKASISITTSNTKYNVQYQIDGDEEGKWREGTTTTVTASNLELDFTVYARLWDGANGGSSASITIREITPPQINMNIGQVTSNSIQVSASAIDNEAGMPEEPKYKYYIKKSTDANYPDTPTYEGAETTYTFSGLTHNTEYDIKIEVADKAGNVGEITSEKNNTVKLTAGNGNITFGEITWDSSGKASISMSTTTSYTIQYQVNSTTGKWETGTTASNLDLDATVHARLWDGVNGGDSISTEIKDTVIPNAATIVPSPQSTNTASTITATVTQSDSQSGVNIGACKWVYNTTSTEIGTNAADYTGGTFSSASQNLRLKVTTPGTYYLHVLTTDNAGNVRETISQPITVVELVTGISLNKTSTTIMVGSTETLTATITPDNASNKTVKWKTSNTAVATVSEGTITAVGEGTATITATAEGGFGVNATCEVTVSRFIGAFVEYNVPYQDMYTKRSFTSTTGWRYIGEDSDGNKLIISTGIPLRLYFYDRWNAGRDANGWWGTDDEVTELFGAKYSAAGYNYKEEGYPRIYASTGLLLHFEDIPYRYSTSEPSTENTMTGTVKGNGASGVLGATLGTAFRASEISDKIIDVHCLKLEEVNRALGRTFYDTSSVEKEQDINGLYVLKDFDDAYTNLFAVSWVCVPGNQGEEEDRYLYLHSNGAVAWTGKTYFADGVRPVVTLNSSVKLVDSNGDGVLEIK